MRAMIPTKAPTDMALELLSNGGRECLARAHELELLVHRGGVAADDRVRAVEGLDLVGEGRVVDEGRQGRRETGVEVA